VGVKKPSLIIKEGGFPGTTFELSSGSTLIGRNPTTDITLVDEGISREHAVIEWEGNSFTIEDLQSTNGTKVNGTRVRSTVLRDGDEVQIGRTLFEFRTP
jgi:pSer/pThr/pTyr-binding forkhead associated (FHA) protein